MIKFYKTIDGKVTKIDEAQDGCWVSLIRPNEQELKEIANRYKIELDDLRDATDEEERSRIQVEDNYTMVLVDVPSVEVKNKKETYVTIPMSIFLTKEAVITVCLENTSVLKGIADQRTRNCDTSWKTRFLLQILYRNASLYLTYLRNINKKSEAVETELHKSTKNRELIELLELEKSLVYFTTSLRSNEGVLEKIMRTETIKKYPEDTELLEDVIIENKQAMEMANIYSGILSGMMDAFASVISNNLNIVMKFLATVTIVMSIPTMIFSAYGMNVNLSGMPFAGSVFGFGIVILMSVVISLVVAVFLAKKNLF
ncbi:MAG: magnesium transporter CorA family protein [Clostridia bacterium]|nr:magnesium transporter CorA family protein [Clostridia bacterium]